MNILCVIDSLGSGGAQRQLVELALGLKKEGHLVSFLTYHPQDFYKELLIAEGISIHCIQEPSYIKRLLKMRYYMRTGKFDNVISFLEASCFISEIAGFPYRDWRLIVGERSANPNILKSFKLRFYRWFHLFASYIVANSDANLKMVKQINPFLLDSKCKVIYNALDLDKWSPDDSYYSFGHNKVRIVIAASHQRLKNLKGLIEAVNLLTEEEKEKLEIEWYGDHGFDSSYDEGQNLIKEYGLLKVFKFYDATLEIRKKFLSADVIGLFSHHEGLPNAICEGMALGKPILATTVSDLPLIIDNSCGFLCDSRDPSDISHKIKMYLSMDYDQMKIMGNNSRKRALNLFSKDNILNQYKNLLKL